MGLTRQNMVEEQLMNRGIKDSAVLGAFKLVPRELFVPDNMKYRAYEDNPLPIEEEQTISQPYVVACMVEALEIKPEDRVLDVGTGSGYAAAILSRLAKDVFSVERFKTLATTASNRLQQYGYTNVCVACRDGCKGWPEVAPFDAILVSASATEVPPELLHQLKPGGRLVIPVGHKLLKIVKETTGKFSEENLGAVNFVPLVKSA